MKNLILFAAFLVCSVSTFAQCSYSLHNTIANLEGIAPEKLSKKEFRKLAVKYADMVGEKYDQSEFNAIIAHKLCAMLETRKTDAVQCLSLEPNAPAKIDSLMFDSLQAAILQNGTFTLADIETIQAGTLPNDTEINAPAKVPNFVPIPLVLKQLRKEGLSPKAARCEVKQRIEANNGKKYDYKTGKEVEAVGMNQIKCDSTKKSKSNGGAKKSKNKVSAKFKVKFSFKKSLRRFKEKINLVFGTCLK